MEKASKTVCVSYWKPKGTNDRVCCITLENGARGYGVYRSDNPVNKAKAKAQAFKAAMREVKGKQTVSSGKSKRLKTFVYLTKGQIDFLIAVEACADGEQTFAIKDVALIQFISPRRAKRKLQALSDLGIIEGLSIRKGIVHFERIATIENLY